MAVASCTMAAVTTCGSTLSHLPRLLFHGIVRSSEGQPAGSAINSGFLCHQDSKLQAPLVTRRRGLADRIDALVSLARPAANVWTASSAFSKASSIVSASVINAGSNGLVTT